eukprot:TRINITY_DN810_c0_g4_i5.p1 TRINITY_DN810_c0_g4~~TRINITY_DN810_c0_g4_i5.p1  ORF type:complete len:179 (+),score=56.15 TRINITY_DN810_c0_g4_i5:870-1406(+)
MQGCTTTTLTVSSKIITSTLEMFHCQGMKVVFNTEVHTVQADINTDISLTFSTKQSFGMIVWAGTRNLTVKVEEFELKTGFEVLQQEYKNLREDIDQFKIHFVTGKLVSEKVVRLDNGFPTTKREADEYDRRQEANLQKRAKEMGITIKRKQPTGPKVGRNDPCPCGSGRKYKACCAK